MGSVGVNSGRRRRQDASRDSESIVADLPLSLPGAFESDISHAPSSSSLAFPDGIKILHDLPNAATDICFIHGLTGDRETTWTAAGQSKSWPQQLLPQKINNARILTWGYDAYIVRNSVASTLGLLGHSRNLLIDLTHERISTPKRPLVFVAHSLGGLVCKRAVTFSRNHPDERMRDIFESTAGIIFLGTPHKGCWMAKWATIPVEILGTITSVNNHLLEVLKETPERILESIQEDFLTMVRERSPKLRVACFYEELPLYKDVSLVTKESATFESYIPISIHANHSDMVKFASAEETGFKRLLGELRWMQSQASQTVDMDVVEECLKSLAFPLMETRMHDVKPAQEGTCNWLCSHEKYKTWAASDRGMLWIRGKPGSGKSTLLKHALAGMPSWESANDGGFLSFSFFFQGQGDLLQRSPLGLYLAMLYQILLESPEASPELVTTFKRREKTVGKNRLDWDWHPEELQRLLFSALSSLVTTRRSVCIWIDALDECGEDNAVEIAASFRELLQDLPRDQASNFWFRMCFSCRHYPDVDPDSDIPAIHVEDENLPDIATFVHTKLADFQSRTGSAISTFIVSRSQSVFLWARLVVEQVLHSHRRRKPLKKIEAEIQDLPQDLSKLYRLLIQDLEVESLRLFQWINCAIRPLSTTELQWAMLIEPDADPAYLSLEEYRSRHDCYQEDPSDFMQWIKNLGHGLTEVIAVPSADLHDWDNTYKFGKTRKTESGKYIQINASEQGSIRVVQFIHQSVKDFFLDSKIGGLRDVVRDLEPEVSLTSEEAVAQAHHHLSKACISYLMTEEVRHSTQDRYQYFPLLNYSSASWIQHIKAYDSQSELLEHVICHMGWPLDRFLDTWMRVDEFVRGISRVLTHRKPYPGDTLLHIAARWGLVGMTKAILDHRRGDTVVLARDADINQKNEEGDTPLAVAARHGREAVVGLLIGTGKVDVNSRSRSDGGKTPLMHASSGGRESVVQILIDNGADLTIRDSGGHTAMHWAAIGGHEGVIQMLLHTGKIGIDDAAESGETAFFQASYHGHLGVMKQLFSWSAGEVDVDKKNRHGDTPIFVAAEKGREDIVAFLTQTPEFYDLIDPDVVNCHCETPLFKAAEKGHHGIVRMLLDTGRVNVNARDSDGLTVLDWALEWCPGLTDREITIKHLKDAGAVESEEKVPHWGKILDFDTVFNYAYAESDT